MRIERIVSSGSQPAASYRQTEDEWVMLVRGQAQMEVEGQPIPLQAGSMLSLPAGTEHRVLSTSQDALWLAAHGSKPMTTDAEPYVHGYSSREAERLRDQADALTELLHHDTQYPDGSRVLEAGCGVGAQTVTLARRSPGAQIIAVDRSRPSLDMAQRRLSQEGLGNVELLKADLTNLPFEPKSFDHLFICFVLEHLPNPEAMLAHLLGYLKPGATVTVIEGDHGSMACHPESPEAHLAVDCLVKLQARAGGDALIGRRLYPLLVAAGVKQVQVTPRLVYVDSSRPELVSGFTLNTFTAMVEGVTEQALASGLVDPETWTRGLAGLRRAAEKDGVFCYTFFKGVGTV